MKKQHAVYHLLILAMVVAISGKANAQRFNSKAVVSEFNQPLAFPWTGGLDAAQYNEVDLNLDGIMDLLVFDRRGNRKLCFINEGIPGEILYGYAPAFAELLPPLYEWARFADYDMDGKMDIFTYSPGYSSMMVYHNISAGELKFQRVVYPYLTSFQGGGYVNILVTNADYPGIVDVDHDGDLDILTFWGMGSFLELHQNMSMEKYGIPDSLDFMQTNYCWGRFAESDESNVIYLDTCLGLASALADRLPQTERHTGSTLLFTDLNGDGNQDLLLGDVDYPGLFALYNDEPTEPAHINRVDTLFPQNSETIRLFAMPAASIIDVDNDGLKDLLVGVFDPGLTSSQNKQSSWCYINTGTTEIPEYVLTSKEFLQENMIDRGSGAYPVFYDFDGDGLMDLFIGNYGYYAYSYYENYFLRSVYHARIGYYKNVGTIQNPVFQLWEDDFGSLGQLHLTGLVPAFDDLDGDGDPDMLVGKADGRLLLMINTGFNSFSAGDEAYFGIDVGEFSTPQLFDLNKDGLKDLVIGEKGGNLNYYQNIGTIQNPKFEYVTDSLGKVNVTDYSLSYDGYSVPCFYRGVDGSTGLISGSEQGNLFNYTHIDENLTGKFTLSSNLNTLLDTTGVDFDRGIRTSGAIAPLRGDGTLQLLIGNYSGGLEFYNGDAGVLSGTSSLQIRGEMTIRPNPATSTVLLDRVDFQSGAYKVYVVSMQGQTLPLSGVKVEEGTLELDISFLKQGVYLLVFQNDNLIQTGKLIVLP